MTKIIRRSNLKNKKLSLFQIWDINIMTFLKTITNSRRILVKVKNKKYKLRYFNTNLMGDLKKEGVYLDLTIILFIL